MNKTSSLIFKMFNRDSHDIHNHYGIDTAAFNKKMDEYIEVAKNSGLALGNDVKDFFREYLDSAIFKIDDLNADFFEVREQVRENFSKMSAANDESFKTILSELKKINGRSQELEQYLKAETDKLRSDNRRIIEYISTLNMTVMGLRNDFKRYAGNYDKAMSVAAKIEVELNDKENGYHNDIRNGWAFLCLGNFDRAIGEFNVARTLKTDGHEAYFGLALATHKIQLLDVNTGEEYRQIPIYCGMSYNDVYNNGFKSDPFYKRALELAEADAISHKNYQECGDAVDEVIGQFKSLNSDGKKYNCFICCKVTELDKDNKPIAGTNTADDEWARRLHKRLCDAGLKPFYSEIDIAKQTKELAKQYEAHILYALYNSKCMIIVCSKQDYIDNSKYMQNECCRFAGFSRERGIKDLSNMLVIRANEEVRIKELWKGDRQDIIRGGLNDDLAFERAISYVREKVSGGARYSVVEKICPVCGKVYERGDNICSREGCNGARLVTYGKYLELQANKANEIVARAESQANEKIAEAEKKSQALISEAQEEKRKLEEELSCRQRELENVKHEAEEYRKKAFVNNSAISNFKNSDFSTLQNYNKGDFVIEGKVLKKYVGAAEAVKIPESVTSIDDYAFISCRSLMSIKIPNSVTIIGKYAFKSCGRLTSIEIPNSVKSIGDYAFYGCGSLARIKIPNGVKSIGDYVFGNCDSLTSIEIPNSVTSIGSCAFYGCSSLTSIEIPNSVTIIGKYAFKSCGSLTSIEIPNSVTSIGSSAFSGCGSLTSIAIPNSVMSIGDSAFSGCSSLTSIAIPNSVMSIGDSAFSGCSSLTSIDIPNGVPSLGDSAFSWCSSLTSIAIPNSVTSIGSSAFSGCGSLTSIEIPNSVTSMGDNAFNGCSSLARIKIPNGVKSIGDYVFENCGSLTSIEIPNSVTSIGSSAFSGCGSLTSIAIPNSVTSIGSSAFSGCSSLTSIEISNRIASIRDYAFYGCRSLTSIEISNSVTSIGSSAFSGCGSLASIAIPNSVTSIGSSAFRRCGSLTSIEIPNSVTSIGNSAFSYCTRLSSIKVANDNPIYYSADNCIIEKKTKTLICGCGTSIIPNSVTSVGDSAFSGCSRLKSAKIPNSVNAIGKEAFYGCISLNKVEIPNSVNSIKEGVFYGCRGLISVEIPNSVTSIGGNAFKGSHATIYCQRKAKDKPVGWDKNWHGGCKVVWGYKGSNK